MGWLAAAAGTLLVGVIMWDAFEALVLPRRVTRRLRPTRFFYRVTWRVASSIASVMKPGGRRETYLSFYGPLSLLLLLNLWAASLVLGFALVHWGAGTRPEVPTSFGDYVYMSGETFFTLGYGDITPSTRLGRILSVTQSGTGFGFLAVVIGYLPVLYQSFSRREVQITLLDSRAGSPPSAEELLRRHGGDLDELADLFRDWERWAAELLESHLSYPVLAFYRSQHDNQSWLGALTTILDASALAIVGIEGACARQAQLTFAMARHAVVDLAQVFGTRPAAARPDRLPPGGLARLRAALAGEGLALKGGPEADARLSELRGMYEPYVYALGDYLLMPLPAWAVASPSDNWRTSAWERRAAGGALPLFDIHDDD